MNLGTRALVLSVSFIQTSLHNSSSLAKHQLYLACPAAPSPLNKQESPNSQTGQKDYRCMVFGVQKIFPTEAA